MDIIANISLQTPERLVLPGEHLTLNDQDARSLIERGFASRVSEVASESEKLENIQAAEGDPPVEFQDIVAAIDILGEGDFGQDGKPLVKALEKALGRNITQGDRDHAWAHVKKIRTS